MITPSARCFRAGSLLRPALFVLFIGTLAAQQANPPAAAPAQGGEPDKVLVLNPFVVTTDGDVGYQAQNSLSGSRLNTKLRDMAVPTTVFTQELLQDIGTTNVDQLVEYMSNSRPDYPEAENIYWGDDRTRFRIRGLPAFNYSVNFFESSLRLDVYNTDRVEQSRGPNSILFGLGSPGGVVNVTTKKANVQRAFGSISGRVTSENGWRTVLDFNQPLIKNKLSLRIATVSDHKDTWREHEFDDQDRLYATLGWQISPTARLDAEWEHGLVNKSIALPHGAIDAYSIWANAGRNVSNTPNAALGIARVTAADRLVFDTTTGQLRNVKNTNTTVTNTVGGVSVYYSDFSVMPKEVVLANGPAFPQDTNYSRANVSFTQTITPKLNLAVAANYQRSHHDNVRGAGATTFQVDTTVTLPSGAANPNVGRPYIESQPINSWADDLQKDLRASLSYEFDLGHIFGKHTLAVLGQKSWITAVSNQYAPRILVNPLSTASPENAANGVYFRTYYDLNGSAASMTAGDWRTFDLSNIVDGAVTRQAKFIGTIPGGQNNYFERESAIGVLQSHFFNDHLVTVAGYRVDNQDSYYSPTGFRGPAVAPFVLGYYQTPRSTTPVKNRANNLTFSGLYHVTDWFSLTYNQAENSALPDPTGAIINPDGSQRPPAPRGKSKDLGIKLDFGQRLSLSLLRFQTTANKDIANVNADIESKYPIIWTALGAAGVTAPDGSPAVNVPSLFNRYTFNSAAKGYELELTANPTKNWRVFLNISTLDLRHTSIGREGIAYLEKYRSYWTQGNNGRVRIDGSGLLNPVADNGDAVIETVAEQIGAIDKAIATFYTLAEGEMARGQNKRRSNLRTNYSFTSGALNGFSIGGGLRYRSPEVIDYTSTASGTNVVWGKANFLVDLNVGYRSQVKVRHHNIRWSVQVNADNLLNKTDVLPLRSVQGSMVQYIYQDPREVFLTTKFDF
jgi:outer membrane receptor protein involved in Fe transport